MPTHRSTEVRVSNDPQLINFEPGTALENLRAETVDIEALARAAEAAADGLPAPTTDRQRLVFGRIQSLEAPTSSRSAAAERHHSGGRDGPRETARSPVTGRCNGPG